MVHDEIFGRPAIVGDAHVPAAPAPAALDAAALAVDPLDEDEDEDEDELPDVLTDEGAVGNRVVLF